MNNLHTFRHYLTIARTYGRTTSTGQSLIRRAVAEEKAGRSAREVLVEQRATDRGYAPPKGVA